jgi:hypothetical protein
VLIRNSYKILERNPEKKTPLGRLRRRWKVNLKLILMIWTGISWLRTGSRGWLSAEPSYYTKRG